MQVPSWLRVRLLISVMIGYRAHYTTDSAIINSPDGTENIWIAKVLGLKRRNTPEGIEGWALVRWYYSVRDIKEIPNFVQNL